MNSRMIRRIEILEETVGNGQQGEYFDDPMLEQFPAKRTELFRFYLGWLENDIEHFVRQPDEGARSLTERLRLLASSLRNIIEQLEGPYWKKIERREKRFMTPERFRVIVDCIRAQEILLERQKPELNEQGFQQRPADEMLQSWEQSLPFPLQEWAVHQLNWISELVDAMEG